MSFLCDIIIIGRIRKYHRRIPDVYFTRLAKKRMTAFIFVKGGILMEIIFLKRRPQGCLTVRLKRPR